MYMHVVSGKVHILQHSTFDSAEIKF
jgi:hypothetical protein